ncbi:hypothetical protein ACFWJ4_16685 [Kitasatospora sp. NPDC127067]|uniref:hypothetical protein n=1 Tax=Kitasatospora sp. NPDC127067 TaxID=3347126 RepID=UPI00364EB84B
MTTRTCPAVCRDHTDLTTRHRGCCPVEAYGTVREQLLALLGEHLDGQPLCLERGLRLDKATVQAVRRLAFWLDVRPGTVWRHARGTRWPASARLRRAVGYRLRQEFCVVELIEQEARRAKEAVWDARRRAARE